MKNISPLYKFSLKGGGWDEQRQLASTKNATLCGDRACRVREMQARARFVTLPRNPLRRSCASSARTAGESAICLAPAQPSAEIVRVECAKCRRECDLSRAAQPSAEIVRVECAKCRRERNLSRARNPLRRSCVSSAQNAGESAIGAVRAQPSAGIVRRVDGKTG